MQLNRYVYRVMLGTPVDVTVYAGSLPEAMETATPVCREIIPPGESAQILLVAVDVAPNYSSNK